MRAGLQIAITTAIFIATIAAAIFVPAGTLDYWQAWLMLAVYTVCAIGLIVYLAVTDPDALQRRTRGPLAEESPEQRRLAVLLMACLFAAFVVPGLDHRFGWSQAPAVVAWMGDALFAGSLVLFLFVMRANTFAATNIAVEPDQRVATTGPYAIVRHPMYSGALIAFVGIPLALGSYWAVLLVIPAAAILAARLLDEERFLIEHLPGYAEFMNRTRWRLVPGIF